MENSCSKPSPHTPHCLLRDSPHDLCASRQRLEVQFSLPNRPIRPRSRLKNFYAPPYNLNNKIAATMAQAQEGRKMGRKKKVYIKIIVYRRRRRHAECFFVSHCEVASEWEKKAHRNVVESLNFNAEWNESYAMIFILQRASERKKKFKFAVHEDKKKCSPTFEIISYEIDIKTKKVCLRGNFIF